MLASIFARPALAGRLAVAAVVAIAPPLAGCNVLTGTAELGADGGGGAGGEASAGPAGSGGPAGTGSTGSGKPACAYPKGTYGAAKGDTVPPGLVWKGYRPGAGAQITSVPVTDYLDCDGSQGIDALLVDTSATWCAACQQEASDFASNVARWNTMGIRVLTLMVQDEASNPASPKTALAWRMAYHLDKVGAVVADPAFTFSHPGSVGLPLQAVVDPRTMKIIDVQEGYSGTYDALEALARKNKGH